MLHPIHDLARCVECARRAFRNTYHPELPEADKVALWAKHSKVLACKRCMAPHPEEETDEPD